MENFKIYLAGGMSGMNGEEQRTWRKRVSEDIKEDTAAYKYLVDIISPPNYYNFENPSHDSEFEIMRYDLMHVISSNLIIVNFNNPKSIGTAMELAIAYEHNIPVIGLNAEHAEIHPWLEAVCWKMFDDIDELCKYVKVFYLI